MEWLCQTCGKAVGRTDIEDIDTKKHYCSRVCFDKRSRRRPFDHPTWLDTDDAELLREEWSK